MSLLLLLLLVVLLPAAVQGAVSSLEAKFLSVPDPKSAREHLKFYTSLEHVAGTPGDYKTAVYTLEQFKSYGLDAHIESFRALVAYPNDAKLRLVGGPEAQLAEDIVSVDPTSDSVLRNHTYHGYSPSGNVTGELVFINYGQREDFEYVTNQLGIDLSGKIALVKYGRSFRGLKVLNAQNYGMAGCLIYSDPQDDGYAKGNTYPEGPWRPASGVQRGSVQFLSRCAGDPALVERDPDVCGDYKSEDLIPKIPSLPLSYGDAKVLLAAIQGNPSPNSWHGGLDVDYHVGPGPAQVSLFVNTTIEVRELWNVVAHVPGALFPEEEVVLGNHRDAWVFGAADPNSGTATLLELARGLGVLMQSGWKPLRSIVLCSWDGEEHGLLGSTNFGETRAEKLSKNAIAYLNVDTAVSGSALEIGISPSLTPFISDVLKDIPDPVEESLSLYDTWDKDAKVLGSGSDYTVFLHHLGIASADFSFAGGDKYGVYHSVYDSFYWMEQFGDPQFKLHLSMAKFWGLTALRLADASVLPFNYSFYASQLASYLVGVEKMVTDSGQTIDFSPLSNSITNLFTAGMSVDSEYSSLQENGVLESFNEKLFLAEREFLVPEGLPGRVWFKHLIQAPGLDTGYAPVVFPSIVDALQNGNFTLAAFEVLPVAAKINAVADFLNH
eukprot:TRINITY_DN724_c0_g1_i3.p1 TRINITY_DN724_c0_g1~~TRINITY_DN724_c0_g1_i3.p1  ORF type:complete len:665 (+),score=166.95 TRINITY_DN724_c0_g1_i3:1585-3579(+)